MQGLIEISTSHWAGFILLILFFLYLDLGVFHRDAREVKFKEALAWTCMWVSFGLFFAGAMVPLKGDEAAMLYLTGYLIELSLSMDNVFVMALIFSYFKVPARYQHRVLFWGIMGALVMRGTMILVGVSVVLAFKWVLYLLGAFLVFSGIKMMVSEDEGVDPENNSLVKLARKWFPVTPSYEGQKFVTRWNGRRALTPLALVLLMVETTDLIFAVDSIPAIFGVTTDPFIIFTSNVFAILGLRSLYFVLARAMDYFHLLKYGLSLVLIFIGIKMIIDPHGREPKWFQAEIPTGSSLIVVAVIIVFSIVLSLLWVRKHPPKGVATPAPAPAPGTD